MIFFTKFKLWFAKNALIVVLSAILIGGSYFGIQNIRNKIESYEQTIAEQETSLSMLNGRIESLIRTRDTIENESRMLEQRTRLAEQYRDELIQKLQRHDLTKLSLQKPGLIENRINEATKKVFDDIESITRSE